MTTSATRYTFLTESYFFFWFVADSEVQRVRAALPHCEVIDVESESDEDF
jgi:hypothetical protein